MERTLSPSLNHTYTLNEQNNVNSTIPVYDIIYNLNLGENHYLNPSVYYEQLLPLKLMPPQREGYNFAGWYTDSSYKHPLTEITDCANGNLILYAKWTKALFVWRGKPYPVAGKKAGKYELPDLGGYGYPRDAKHPV